MTVDLQLRRTGRTVAVPVNFTDRYGLAAEGPDQSGCYVNGFWDPTCNVSGINRFTPTTAFEIARNRLMLAAQAFGDRESFSTKCLRDVAAISAAAPSYIASFSITIATLQAAALQTTFLNGVGSQASQAVLYPTSPQAANSVAVKTVGDIFANPNKIVTAVTTLGGNTMYINPAAVSFSFKVNEGMIMHEMLHELGLADDAIGTGLHSLDPSIAPDQKGEWTNTRQFSTKFTNDCFSGKDNAK